MAEVVLKVITNLHLLSYSLKDCPGIEEEAKMVHNAVEYWFDHPKATWTSAINNIEEINEMLSEGVAKWDNKDFFAFGDAMGSAV